MPTELEYLTEALVAEKRATIQFHAAYRLLARAHRMRGVAFILALIAIAAATVAVLNG